MDYIISDNQLLDLYALTDSTTRTKIYNKVKSKQPVELVAEGIIRVDYFKNNHYKVSINDVYYDETIRFKFKELAEKYWHKNIQILVKEVPK